MDTDEECDEGDENASCEDRVGFAGDYRADGFGISGNPDGGLAEGAGAGGLLAEDELTGFELGELGGASV